MNIDPAFILPLLPADPKIEISVRKSGGAPWRVVSQYEAVRLCEHRFVEVEASKAGVFRFLRLTVTGAKAHRILVKPALAIMAECNNTVQLVRTPDGAYWQPNKRRVAGWRPYQGIS